MRSVPAGSFERLTSIVALWRAWTAYRSGKRRRPAVARFEVDADRRICTLHAALRSDTWRPGGHRVWTIRDPKRRLIAAAPLQDRVVHQALVTEIGPTYDRGFVDHHYACGHGRGPHRAVLRHVACMRRARYRLALDIKRYFPSIVHDTLLELLFARLRDERTRRLVERIVRAGGAVYATSEARQVLDLARDPLPPGRGLPIGSRFSQWVGALYLDGLDHFVKRTLRFRAYQRFMDDMTLFDDDPTRLEHARTAVSAWLQTHRGLALNPKHWAVHSTREPAIYLGYRVSRAGISPAPARWRALRKNVSAAVDDVERLERVLAAYRGIMEFG